MLSEFAICTFWYLGLVKLGINAGGRQVAGL